MENFNYTNEMYEEDFKMCRFFLSKCVRLYPFLKNNEDDLFSDFLLIAWNCRKTFDENKNIKYSSFLFIYLKFACLNFIKKECNNQNNFNLSLDANLSDDDDGYNFLSILGVLDNSLNDNLDYEILKNDISEVLTRFSEKHSKIICDYLECCNFEIVAKKNKTTRQNVDVIICKFRKYFQDYINNINLNNNDVKFDFNNKYDKLILASKYNISMSYLYSIRRAFNRQTQEKSFLKFLDDYIKRQSKKEKINFSELCEKYNIDLKTAYNLYGNYKHGKFLGLFEDYILRYFVNKSLKENKKGLSEDE